MGGRWVSFVAAVLLVLLPGMRSGGSALPSEGKTTAAIAQDDHVPSCGIGISLLQRASAGDSSIGGMSSWVAGMLLSRETGLATTETGLSGLEVADQLGMVAGTADVVSGLDAHLRKARSVVGDHVGDEQFLAGALPDLATMMEENSRLRRVKNEVSQEFAEIQRWDADVRQQSAALRQEHEKVFDDDAHVREQDAELSWQNSLLLREYERSLVAHPASFSKRNVVVPIVASLLVAVACFFFLVLYAMEIAYASSTDSHGAGSEPDRPRRAVPCCGLSTWAARSFCILGALSGVGFLLLWRQGFIQPILLNLCLYFYLAVVFLLIVCTIVGEAWRDLSWRYGSAIQKAKNLQHLDVDRFFVSLQESED